MTDFRGWFGAVGVIVLSTGLGTAQVGTKTGPGNPVLACSATVPTPAQLRQEGYTELLGDILITCTGGTSLTVGSPIPTTDLVVVVKAPYLPLTSRILGSTVLSPAVSEALLIIDDAGSSLTTGATGGYGPQAPQSLCTTAQQQTVACTANVGLDGSGQYQVAVQPGTSTPAQNIYQGAIGDSGANSVTFYNVPVLPPVYQGVSRTYRITNIRIPPIAAGLIDQGKVNVLISAPPNQALPLPGSAIVAGTVNNAMTAGINATPAGGQNPFATCVRPAGAALAAQITFSEGFQTMFKTRVAPQSNSPWASTVPNTGTPGQNVPGSQYGGFGPNSESGFILPAASAVVSGVTYTAGLTDFGTRLKAVFSNIPTGLTLYVSTTNAAVYTVPGGTSTAPYAVLVAGSQSGEANNDGAAIAPLSAGTVTGSDGLTAYPLVPNGGGSAAAIWEVVNANPLALDTLTFSIYVAFNGTPQITGQNGQPANNVALSFAPEPGGGSFSQDNAETGLSGPVPRFNILTPQQGGWVTINSCTLNVNTATLPFTFTPGGATPPSQSLSVTTNPSGATLTVSPQVTTPSGGTWLSASYSSGTLTVSVNPSGLPASGTAYTGNVNVMLGVGGPSVAVPVTLTVNPSICAVNGNGPITVAAVQLEVNEALGSSPVVNDLNGDGVVNVVDVQIVANAALSLGCTAH